MEEVIFEKEKVIAACRITAQKKEKDRGEFRQAEKYLIAFQKSRQGWALSCEILDTENLDLTIYTQVAIVLKQKLQYDFNELHQTEYLNIAQLILKFLTKHYQPAITSQLSLSLVILYMHAFQILGDLIEILGQSLFTIDSKEDVALDIIKLIAEEAEDKKVIISKKQKEQYTTYLEENIKPKVFTILDKIGKNTNIENLLKFKLLDAFQEWFYFSRKDESIIKNIASHSCFSLALTSMNDPSLAENARECVIAIIKAVKNPEQHQDIFEVIFKYIIKYIDECNSIIKEDIDHVLEYVKVFRAFGVKFAKLIILQPNPDLVRFLQFLVELTANQKIILDILIELEDFWKAFSEDFVSLLKKGQNSHKIAEFHDMLKALILIALDRIRMNQDELNCFENRPQRSARLNEEYGEEDDDEEIDYRALEEKNDERRNCKNIILYVQDILGFETTFNIIVEVLKEIIIQLQGKNITDWENPGWEIVSNIECVMFIAKSCIIAQDKNPNLTEFFQVIMAAKFKGVKFNRTKIELIENTAEKASVNEEIMLTMFNYLADNLSNPSTKEHAGQALITLCENWSNFVIKNFESFLILRNKFDDNDDLIIALAVAIAHDKHTNVRERYLAQLCKPFAERIVKSAESPNSDSDLKIIREIQDNLKKLSMIFGKMPKWEDENVSHPLEPVFQELWPIFKALFQKYSLETKIINKLCNVVKKCMKSLNTKFKPFILEYFDLICEIFILNPSPEFLYSIETSASIFGKMPDMIQPLTKVYEFVSSATLNYLNDKELKSHNQLLEDFFGMLFRYTKYVPSVVLSSNTLEINLHLAELTIGIDQPNVEKTLFLFLEYLFKLCRYHPQNDTEKVTTEIIVNKYGSKYIKKLIWELTKYPEEQLRNYLLDIIFASFLKLKQHTLEWLKEALQEIPEAILVQGEKVEMIKALNEIDVSTLKNKNKDEEESEKLIKISEKFSNIFDDFSYR